MTVPANGERRAAVRHAQRASGQTAALAPMILGGQPFPQIAQQLLAARGSLDSLLIRLVELEVRDCLPGCDNREEVVRLLRAALGRGGSAGVAGSRHRCRPSTSLVPLKERAPE